MLDEAKSIKEIFNDHGCELPLDLEFGKKFKNKMANKQFVIEGNMKFGNPNIFYGWYILHGRLGFWSAYGDETVSEVCEKSRWVL